VLRRLLALRCWRDRLWLALAVALAALTSKVADWFVMTDELLYERWR
jgi:hypothetical protein